jgi:acyl carrier protein
MTEADVKDGIAQVVRKIAPEVDLNAIGGREHLRQALDIDSFDFLNVLVGLHERFGVDVPESDYGQVETLDDLIAYVAARVRK